ncbi:MAG: HAMP domain-containing sensor histidine kinase [Solibacillus sp.]
MKWKLTGRFLMAMMSIVILVIFANTALLFYLLIQESKGELADLDTRSAEDFTRTLSSYMTLENDIPSLNKEGLELLQSRNAWLQFLDNNGTEVAQINAPATALKHYRPVDIVQTYKYQEHDRATTMFISNFDNFTYLVGIRDTNLARTILSFNPNNVLKIISTYLLYIIMLDLVIAFIVGLLFSSILTKPLYHMMERIQQMKNRSFIQKPLKRPGIYKQVFTNIQDVSEELQVQELERAKLEKMRSEWMSNVSHDMKTPLASIQGYAELLQDASTQEQREYAAIIEQKAVYMRELLDDFNLTMRLRNGQLPLQKVQMKLESFVREVVIDVLNNPAFEMRDVSLDSKAPPSELALDPHLMKRAMTNFIVNALIHNEEARVEVVLLELETRVVIEIRDNGKGMSEEDTAQVFERYYRGSNTENIHGTGLGTAIARDIIAAHGGEVMLESTLNIGTVVRIML